MGSSKNLRVYNFAILLKLRKFDAREIYMFCSTVFRAALLIAVDDVMLT